MEIFKNIKYQDLLSHETPIPHDVEFTFEGDDRTVSAHRFVLSLASPYFRVLFYGSIEAIPRPHKMQVIGISFSAFEKMILFVYACLANQEAEYVLVHEEDKITGQDDITTIIETNRSADYYGLTALAELCGEAMAKIRVNRQNVEWLDSLLGLGPGEEALKKKVDQAQQIISHLEARRMELVSEEHDEYKDKSDALLMHELDEGHICDIIVLKGSRYYGTGTYKKMGEHNQRPLYQMISEKMVGRDTYIYYTGDGYWAVGSLEIIEKIGNYSFHFVRIPDKSLNGGPPVYTPSTAHRVRGPNGIFSDELTPETGMSLSCGPASVCQKIQVVCDDPHLRGFGLLGEYETNGEYNDGVMVYQNRNNQNKIEYEFYRYMIGTTAKTGAYTEKKLCPCQAPTARLGFLREPEEGPELEFTCSHENCMCLYHVR